MTSPVVVQSPSDARRAMGTLIRFTGTVQREKPGDVVLAGGVDILCPGHRFDDELVNAEVTVQGTLGQLHLPEATVNERGEISQGVMPGSAPRLVLSGLVVIATASR